MITSAHNSQIRDILALNQRPKERRKTGLFVAEGKKLFTEAPKELIRKVFVSESFAETEAGLLADIEYEIVEESLFGRICDTKTPQGILCILEQPSWKREALLGDGKQSPFLLLLEDLQDPGNVGTILRTAEGAGVTGVLLSEKCADPFQPKVIRSTMGSIFRVPIYREPDLAQALSWLRDCRIHTYGAHLRGVCDYNAPSYREGTAFLIGNEGNGLSPYLTEHCDTLIRIPMEGKLESLNAAIASAVLMYTVHAQRNDG